MINTDSSSTSFRVSRVSIGERNFLGNHITYPARGRTGDNCLLATKVLVPIDGKVREGVGLLGSPSFEIPRTVERDGSFDHLRTKEELARHLAAKNRYNRHTMGVYLLVRWINLFGVTLITLAGVELHDRYGAASIAMAMLLSVFFSVAYGVFVERATMRFHSLSPQFCSIYDPYFWWHERLWKLLAHPVLFNGTPFKSVIWRLLGVRIGSRVFDDGCHMPERTLVTIGDDVTLNAGSEIQCHSQEDGAFKSDRTTIGNYCTIGVGALVHYGVTMGDGAVLATDSFLMKGEEVPPYAWWGGNPAVEISANLTDMPHSGGALDQAHTQPVRPAGRHRLVVEKAATEPVRSARRHRRTVAPDRPPRDVTAGMSKGRHDEPDQHCEPTGHRGPSANPSDRRRRSAAAAIDTSVTAVAPSLVGASSPAAPVSEGTIRWER